MKSLFEWVSTTYRKRLIESKKNRLLKLYEKKNYEEMANLFKT